MDAIPTSATLPSFSATRLNERDVAAAELIERHAASLLLRLDLAWTLRTLIAKEMDLVADSIRRGEHVQAERGQAPHVAVEVQENR